MANNLSPEKKTLAVSMLCEGSSIRATERVTGVHRDTIMRLGVRMGQQCAKIQSDLFRNLPCQNLEQDEIWGFIGSKQKNATRTSNYGDVWTWIALDVDSKLIPTFVAGRRDGYHCRMFIEDLSARLSRRVQLSTDNLAAYPAAIEEYFGQEIDYGQIVKTYSTGQTFAKNAASRYSPADVIKVEKTREMGTPDVAKICTSHVEKQNHTLRMHCRRLTRLTNAFSKKIDNFEAAVSLNFAYYNLCKRHIAVKATPAQAAGVTQEAWTVAELVERCGE
jgi:IS1 family transposase